MGGLSGGSGAPASTPCRPACCETMLAFKFGPPSIIPYFALVTVWFFGWYDIGRTVHGTVVLPYLGTVDSSVLSCYHTVYRVVRMVAVCAYLLPVKEGWFQTFKLY